MKHLTRRAAIGAALAACLCAPAAWAQDAKAPIFYNIISDDSWNAGMALGQANVAARRGHPVTVFLNVRGVHVADRNTVQGTFGPAGKTPKALLASLIDGGETVLVCGTCMSAAGMAAHDLIDGARVSGPDLTFGALTAEGTIVMSY
jgi:predicted peroxiredoxin